jgi:3-methyl-2-oxobutanoate hydroxymethyltransferase
MTQKQKTISDFTAMKKAGEKIAMITCYDYTSAKLIKETDIDCILVGDSVGMVVSGFESTLPVSLEHMKYHTTAVSKAHTNKFILADMPFLSYHTSADKAIESAGALMQCGAHGVKLEGGEYFTGIVEKLTACSIPVCGHLGMTPQSVNMLGGFKVQGRGDDAAKQLINDATLLEQSGIFMLVLELVPENLAFRIAESLSIPVIGIGAGRYCDGQVLVWYDVLGYDDDFAPKMVKKYLDGSNLIKNAISNYAKEIKESVFPDKDHIFL